MTDLKKNKIAVLCGGRSSEREISLRSGKNVHASLLRQGYDAVMMDTGPDLIADLKKEKVDVVFIMLHGRFGEDGTIQALLELNDIPYTGSKVLASAVSMNKIASKRIWQSLGIPTPRYIALEREEPLGAQAENIRNSFPFPLVVKPASEGSSIGITIVKQKEKLEEVLAAAAAKFHEVFVEEFISGREVTVGLLGTNSDLRALPVLELVPKKEFYDFEAKYTKGLTEFILPARLPKPLYEKTQNIALAAHKALGCRGFSRVDMIIGHDGVPYVNELNSIPGMTDTSDLPAQALHAGISFDELVVKVLESAL